ncbi:MAG: zf-HC2 domain-containing protein [Bacteroidetes bacterium]|nr:zf-HC2 domain-containing protein [Bacteroidota bacterium]
MNCLNESDLQSFLDRELELQLAEEIELHLAVCPACHERFLILKANQTEIFSMLDEVATNDLPFEIPPFQVKQRNSKTKRLIFTCSLAASLLILIGIGGICLNNQKKDQKQIENISRAKYDITRNTDPNQMLHKNQIIVVVTDASGEVIETSVTE